MALRSVQRWVERSQGLRLDRVDWSDQRRGPHSPSNRTKKSVELEILALRSELYLSPLGDHGAEAIHREMVLRGSVPPSIRTIDRVLARHGVQDRKRRVRRPPPPVGWYLPEVAAHRHELDSFDTVSGLVIRGGSEVVVLNGTSVHGGLISCWPETNLTSRMVLDRLLSRWMRFGLPSYAQFDNDTLFQGPHQHRDVIGRVMRACLLLNVIPVFAPPAEQGFQNAVESLNGRWQVKVWQRSQHANLSDLVARSNAFVDASHQRAAARIDQAPTRRPFPSQWVLDLQRHPSGRLIFIRRTNDRGSVGLLGRSFQVDPHWTHRLVRAEVDLTVGQIAFAALRRREPSDQPELNRLPYELPVRRFAE